MNQCTTRTPDPDDGKPPPKKKAPPPMIHPDISKTVFDLYEGKVMTKEDTKEARLLAALWQIAYNLKLIQEQSALNIIALNTIIAQAGQPKCPGCGR